VRGRKSRFWHDAIYHELHKFGIVNRWGEPRRFLEDYRKLRSVQLICPFNSVDAREQARAQDQALKTVGMLDLEAFRSDDGNLPPGDGTVLAALEA
jgi:hypothetical protein